MSPDKFCEGRDRENGLGGERSEPYTNGHDRMETAGGRKGRKSASTASPGVLRTPVGGSSRQTIMFVQGDEVRSQAALSA